MDKPTGKRNLCTDEYSIEVPKQACKVAMDKKKHAIENQMQLFLRAKLNRLKCATIQCSSSSNSIQVDRIAITHKLKQRLNLIYTPKKFEKHEANYAKFTVPSAIIDRVKVHKYTQQCTIDHKEIFCDSAMEIEQRSLFVYCAMHQTRLRNRIWSQKLPDLVMRDEIHNSPLLFIANLYQAHRDIWKLTNTTNSKSYQNHCENQPGDIIKNSQELHAAAMKILSLPKV